MPRCPTCRRCPLRSAWLLALSAASATLRSCTSAGCQGAQPAPARVLNLPRRSGTGPPPTATRLRSLLICTSSAVPLASGELQQGSNSWCAMGANACVGCSNRCLPAYLFAASRSARPQLMGCAARHEMKLAAIAACWRHPSHGQHAASGHGADRACCLLAPTRLAVARSQSSAPTKAAQAPKNRSWKLPLDEVKTMESP